MKLWEVLKALDENPKKRFKSNVVGVEYKISLDGGVVAFEASTGKFTGLSNSRDWQEAKQPVTWQEAIEAWVSGKTIKCTIQGSDYVFDGHKPKLRGQIDTIDRSQLRNGTWYIED